jgi:hypothetical protein
VDDLADDALRATLEARRAQGDAALETLERAIGAADQASRSAERTLGERSEKGPEKEGGEPPAGG